MILAVVAVHAADLLAAVLVTSLYGLSVEANPLLRAALAFGPLGGIAVKAALLAVILAAASLHARARRALVAAALVVGCVGAASGLAALA